MFSRSTQISLAENGYNAQNEYINQIGVVLAFSQATELPAGIEVYWGSLKDISTIDDFLDRFKRVFTTRPNGLSWSNASRTWQAAQDYFKALPSRNV